MAEKVSHPFVIPSEARNLSFFSAGQTQERFLASLGMTKQITFPVNSLVNSCSRQVSGDFKNPFLS
jgi:hypothetical protein